MASFDDRWMGNPSRNDRDDRNRIPLAGLGLLAVMAASRRIRKLIGYLSLILLAAGPLLFVVVRSLNPEAVREAGFLTFIVMLLGFGLFCFWIIAWIVAWMGRTVAEDIQRESN